MATKLPSRFSPKREADPRVHRFYDGCGFKPGLRTAYAATRPAKFTGLLIMCNLYSITTNQAAIIALFRVMNRYVGNLPPMPGVFPDYPAPVVRNVAGERELTMMRWGMPPPQRAGAIPVTNIRNTSSPHWQARLKPENRCLVPFNSFAEYAPEPNPETKKRTWCGSGLMRTAH